LKQRRLDRHDMNGLRYARPARRFPPKPLPGLPVHLGGFTAPTVCGVPPGAWSARTNIPDYVTCPSCR
jgi:hypothetical protein